MLHCPECGNELYNFTRPGDKRDDLRCFSCGWGSIANSRNRKLQVNNTTGYKGVTKASRGNKYCATITVNGKSKHIGSYETAEEAAKNYDRMAVFYHGDNAVTNRDLGLLPSDAIYEDHKKFAEVLREVYSLARGVKSEDYGRTWAETGLVGIYIKLMIKEGRLRELVWKGKQPQVKGESVRDTLMDIAAYAVYGILCLDEDNYDGEQSRQEHLQAMLLNIKEELNNGKTENQGSI